MLNTQFFLFLEYCAQKLEIFSFKVLLILKLRCKTAQFTAVET